MRRATMPVGGTPSPAPAGGSCTPTPFFPFAALRTGSSSPSPPMKTLGAARRGRAAWSGLRGPVARRVRGGGECSIASDACRADEGPVPGEGVARRRAPARGRPGRVRRPRPLARSVRDPGDLLRLTDRDVLLPLDGEARRLVAGSARRVAVVSAISPTGFLTIGWVLIENLRLLRALAALYGGRPGFIGTSAVIR